MRRAIAIAVLASWIIACAPRENPRRRHAEDIAYKGLVPAGGSIFLRARSPSTFADQSQGYFLVMPEAGARCRADEHAFFAVTPVSFPIFVGGPTSPTVAYRMTSAGGAFF